MAFSSWTPSPGVLSGIEPRPSPPSRGSPYRGPHHRPRNGVENAHLLLALAAAAALALAAVKDQINLSTYGLSDLSPLTLAIAVLNSPAWLVVAAAVQNLRRKPSVMTAAALVQSGLNIALPLSLNGLIPASAPLIALLVPAVATALDISRNRSLDGRPMVLTLSAGFVTAVVIRVTVALASAILVKFSVAGGYRVGPWLMMITVSRVPETKVHLFFTGFAVLGSAIALSGLVRPAARGARTRFSAGSITAALMLNALGALPTIAPTLDSSLSRLRLPLTLGLIGGPLLAVSCWTAWSPETRLWFLRKSAPTTITAGGTGPVLPSPSQPGTHPVHSEQDRSTQFGGSGGPAPAGTWQGP